jgi:endonuclease III
MAKTDWSLAVKPLIKKYRNTPHPLEYENLYQLLVMVVLSAQSTDKLVNSIKAPLFEAYPDMASLSRTNVEDLIRYISKVRNFRNKANWLVQIAQQVKNDKKIPLTMEGLTALPGIGRKSANVIMKGAGVKAEGIVVDLHVVRVAPRLGIASGTDPKQIEKQMMEQLDEKDWGDIGMAISHLGRETCRPTHPHHHECIMSPHCEYYKMQNNSVKEQAKKTMKPVKKQKATKR